jgi:hypothetical protein
MSVQHREVKVYGSTMRPRSERSLMPTYRVIFNQTFEPEAIEAGDFKVGDEWIEFASLSGQVVIRVIRASLVDQIIRQSD